MKWTALLGVCALAAAAEVTYKIETVAGGTFCGDGWPATSAFLGAPEGLAVDAAGNIYISDSQDHRIRRIDTAGVITTVAGDGHRGSRGDGGPAAAAQLNTPYGLTIDRAGVLYVADLGNARVRAIVPDGTIRTIAGGGTTESPGGGDATAARLNQPRNVAVDPWGNLYISDFGDHRVYKVTPEGLIERVAGLGWPGSIADGEVVVAEFSPLRAPAGLTVDANGILYVADSGNGRIRRIERGLMSTIPTGNLQLGLPAGLSFDASGALYVADKSGASVVRVMPDAVRIAGDGTRGYAGDGGPAILARLTEPREIAFDRAGNILIADSVPGERYPTGAIRRVTAGGTIATVAGGAVFRPLGDLGPARWAHLEAPAGVAVGADRTLYIADRLNGRIRKVEGGFISTVAGGEEELEQPSGLALDSAGNLLIAEAGGSRIRRLAPDGTLSRVAGLAGGGASGYSGDESAATDAKLNYAEGVAADHSGNVYIADTFNNAIRRVDAGGTVQTIGGKGVPGYAGDGGPALDALLNRPEGVATDSQGNVFVADTRNHAIRRIDGSGRISTVASQLHSPSKMVADAAGNVVIADTAGHRVLRMAADGVIAAIAGIGVPGYGGDEGPALSALLNEPADVALDTDGSIYIADRANNRIRKLTPSDAGPVDPPQVELANVVNAASMLGGPIAPGGLVTIFGTGLGPEDAAGAILKSPDRLDSEVSGTQVLFDGVAAPLVYVQSRQINLQVPYEVAGKSSVEIEVRYNGETRGRFFAAVADAAPAIFTVSGGMGQAAALNESGDPNSAANPAPRGSVLVLYATGEGQTAPDGVTGKLASAPYPAPVLPVGVAIGGRPAEILYAGAAPGYAGLMQVNVRVPEAAGAGVQMLEMTVGGARTQGGVMVRLK